MDTADGLLAALDMLRDDAGSATTDVASSTLTAPDRPTTVPVQEHW